MKRRVEWDDLRGDYFIDQDFSGAMLCPWDWVRKQVFAERGNIRAHKYYAWVVAIFPPSSAE